MKGLSKVSLTALALTSALLAGCFKTTPYGEFRRNTGVAVPECGAVSTVDTTGWFGDGELIYTFYLDEEGGQTFSERVNAAQHWQSLPITETLNRIVYEHFDGKIPRVETGYYYFYDEQHKTHEDDKVENAFSYDFVIGMYDTENRIVYYYEQHT